MSLKGSCDQTTPEFVSEVTTRPVMVPRVLVLDDDATGWAPTVRALRQVGQGVLVSGATGAPLELVMACEAEVVILEMVGAGRDILELIPRLRSASPETQIILTVRDVAFEDAVTALRLGAFDVIRKPCGPCEVVPAVLRAIEARKKAKDAEALLREGQRLLVVRERERLPALVVDLTQKAMRADVVSLMLRDTSGRLYIAHAHGLPSDLLATTRLQIGERIAGRIAELRAPALVGDAFLRDERFEDVVPFGRVRSSIIYPLLSGHRLIGMLNIGRSDAEEPFAEADLARAGIVASQAVLALEAQRQCQRAGMADRLAIVGQVALSIAHEINSPLAAISGQQELALESVDAVLASLKPGPTPTAEQLRSALIDARKCLEDAQVATASVLAVASDLRLAVRSESSQDRVVDLGETIRAAVRLATAEVKRQTSIVRRVEPGLVVSGDSGHLCQVFLGLILNANQALRASETSVPEIRIESMRNGDEFRIDVIDNGPAIPPEDLAQIFEPFHTGKGARAGAGIGLSVANDIVQGLGGRIDVTSKKGEGTSFSVYLPAAPNSTSESEGQRSARATRPCRAA